ncbi:MAG: cache domain-containing protein [Candidatus Aminicenantes bacterium]|nr:cache domain-containing protein [Candidatus Aminicenantes bacterium]
MLADYSDMPSRSLIRRFFDLPLRRKLILSFLAVISFGGIITLVIGTRIEHRTIFSLAESKVRNDLAAAWMVYNEKLNGIRDVVRLSAAREFLPEFFRTGGRDEAAKRLDAIRREYGLDILTLTDAQGRVALRARRPEAFGEDRSGDLFVQRALRKETPAGTSIVPRTLLLEEAPDLAERAYFQFVETPKAAARPGDHEENGMLLQATAPVMDGGGALIGALYGGVLINRNYEIVDRVKDIVFRGEKYKGQDIGTVTIFQGDLRVSTNVLDAQGQRAVGTRVSREVERAVLVDGGRWVGPAFVVREWHITAYEPIKDIDGRIIGMLYVGTLEWPFLDLRNRVMATFAGLAGLCAGFLLVLLWLASATITRPLLNMVKATDTIAKGDLNHRVEIGSHDETGQLAAAFNRMTESLAQANENLAQWGRMLEKRVEERTRELRETQDALVQSQKLASLGKMAAGVAHEINNPLTSITINAHLLLEDRGPDDADRDALTLIAEETGRCAQIVKGLLEFARQTPSEASDADINDIVERTIQLLDKQASVRNVKIIKDLDKSLPLIVIDKNKIQQVVSNLVINACEAMPDGGTLTIVTSPSDDRRQIVLRVADTGVGIPKANMDLLFDPFFTTKSHGTGLGLAVSYGIVHQRGGTIDVESEVGKGSTFTVKLPLEETAPDKKPAKDQP